MEGGSEERTSRSKEGLSAALPRDLFSTPGSFKVVLSHCFLTVFKSNCIFIIHGLHDPGSEQLKLPLVFFNFEKCSCA